MGRKIITTFIFHVLGLILLFIPNQYQGPVVARLAGISLRTLDLTGIGLIVVGSIFLNIYLVFSFKKEIKQIPPKGKSGENK